MRSSVSNTLAAVAALTLVGTSYSLYYSTYLDTSNPAITAQHHLADTHYFATKKNPLNVFFIKKLWIWTTGAFAFLFLTSPTSTRTKQRLYQYLAATSMWALFTTWFFGPALLERLIILTGGECVVTLPSGYILPVPAEYCFAPSSISPATHPSLFAASLLVPQTNWATRPRLRRGHDVSGHIFLLTMSALFLIDQLGASRAHRRADAASSNHGLAAKMVWAVVALEMVSVWVTSVYFHSPGEKFSGLCTCLTQ